MTASEDRSVDREAWRGLLAGNGEGPSELTDARIRAQARAAITPRTGRWWLPASLAASLLLAVVLVQQQYERISAPAVVSESDYATAPAANQVDTSPEPAPMRIAPPPEAPAPRQRGYLANAPAPATNERDAAANPSEPGDVRIQASIAPPRSAVPPLLVDSPAMSDARATSAAPAETPAPIAQTAATESKRDEKEKHLGEIVVTGSHVSRADVEAASPVITQDTAAEGTAQGALHTGELFKSAVAERTPQQWYAEIEKLRAAGKKREAKRELEKLRKVHPGWLEKNHPTDR